MSDPYKILGVSHNASEKEVKQAYRELVRKYHPDNYHDNPLSDLAQEKMKEINEAYDNITRMRETGEKFTPGSRSRAHAAGSPEGIKVRAAIQSGDYALAEQLLNEFPARNAEWNFLMGCLCYSKGWLDDARSYLETAVNMDPGNAEYRQAHNRMRHGGNAYRPYAYGGAGSDDGCNEACRCCSLMMCMNMCCRCM